MKIKLFLLSLVAGFSFVGFSIAGNVSEYHLKYRESVSGIFNPGYSYTVSPLDNYMSDNTLRLSCYTWYNEVKANCGQGCSFNIDDLILDGCSPDGFTLTCYEAPCNFTLDSVSLFVPLLPGGSEAFSGVVSNLSSSINEFIPYIVYIGIGILGVIIGFVALKRLINLIRSKSLSPFR